ncbi:hypothetical protein BsWGS_10180 [Bradybaena similaris]
MTDSLSTLLRQDFYIGECLCDTVENDDLIDQYCPVEERYLYSCAWLFLSQSCMAVIVTVVHGRYCHSHAWPLLSQSCMAVIVTVGLDLEWVVNLILATVLQLECDLEVEGQVEYNF